MTLALLEAAVDALYSYLNANMADKLDALDTEYGDFTLDDIKAWYKGALPHASLPEYPSICLLGESWEANDQLSTDLEVHNHITVIIFVGDDNEEVRFRKLCRYARAVVELLNSGEASYGYTHFIDGRIELSESIRSEPFLQAVAVPISLQKWEAY